MRSPFASRTPSPVRSSESPSPSRTTVSESLMEESILFAESIITKWDLDASLAPTKANSLFRDHREEAKKFLNAISELQSAMRFFISHDSASEKLIRAQNLMEMAMKRLQKEFYSILSENKYYFDPESVSSGSSKASTRSSVSDYEDNASNSDDDDAVQDPASSKKSPSREANRVSESVMADLKSIADCMISAGYGKECVKIYKLKRKSIIDESLYHLGVEKLSYPQIHKMDWDALEVKIKKWLHAIKVSVKTVFYGERILCDHVFSASDSIRESCFAEISRDGALNLLTFPENLVKHRKFSPEKMFRVLDIHEAISDLWPEIDLIFNFESLSAVKSHGVTSLVKLGEVVRTMLLEFEQAIQKDSSKVPAGGGVHPLTRYVMNYLVFLSDYSGPVCDIVGDWPLAVQTPLPESYYSSPIPEGEGSASSAASARLAWLILVLLCKLDGKAQLYKDASLAYLFLANNLNYVVSKVRKSNLALLLGSEWIFKHAKKARQYATSYERMGWSKVLSSLPENPTAEMSPTEAREIFRLFNSGFEETYRKQSYWVIPDAKLRDEVKISLSRKIVPVYRTVYEKYRETMKMIASGMEPIVRFAPDDLDNYLSDLFHGMAISGSTQGYASPSPSPSWAHGH